VGLSEREAAVQQSDVAVSLKMTVVSCHG